MGLMFGFLFFRCVLSGVYRCKYVTSFQFQVAFDVMPVRGDGFEQYRMVCWLPRLHSTVRLPRA